MFRDGWQVTPELGVAGAYRREQRKESAGEQIHRGCGLPGVLDCQGVFRKVVCLFFDTED